MRRFNWPLWSGLLLAILAFLSYFFFFARFPITRDVPWASYLLFLVAIALLVAGWRRAPKKILPTIITVLGLFVAGVFTFIVNAFTKDLPVSPHAPAIGTKAPEIVLLDANKHTVALSQLLGSSNGVLLVFYRGYW
jgi:hypothetical protein